MAAVKAAVATGLVACGFTPSGGGGSSIDAATDGDGPQVIDARDLDAVPGFFCDRSNADLRLCLTFQEGGVIDASGSNLTITATKIGFGPGIVDDAVQVDASSDIHVEENAALDVTTALTMETFVFVVDVPNPRAGLMDNNGQWGMWLGANMRPYCTMGGSTVSGPTIATGQWTHVACVFDNLTYRIFVDGSLFGTVNRQVPAPTGGVDGMNLGQDNTPMGPNDPLSGALDELRIWGSVRSPEQIAEAAGRRGG